MAYTPLKNHRTEIEIKKSKFITICTQVRDKNDVRSFLNKYSVPEATHNCYAAKFQNSAMSSDNGEPAGTAGKPILNAIENCNFNNTAILVIRFFGGIKLGSGGLIRAYSKAASENLRTCPIDIIRNYNQLNFTVDFPFQSMLMKLFNKNNINKISNSYNDKGVSFSIEIDADKDTDIKEQLKDITHGKIKFH